MLHADASAVGVTSAEVGEAMGAGWVVAVVGLGGVVEGLLATSVPVLPPQAVTSASAVHIVA